MEDPNYTDDLVARAEVEESLQRERDELDAIASQASEWEAQNGGATDLAVDPVRARLEAEGLMLPWWDEEDFPLDTACSIAAEACGHVASAQKLAEHGLPLTAASGPIILNHTTGPVVVAALQILGVLHPHLRDTVSGILADIAEARPEPSEEEQKLYDEAHEALNAERYNAFRESMREQGIEILTEEEAAALAESAEIDSPLNIADANLN